MDSKGFNAQRDAIVADALYRALRAMTLTNGVAITSDGMIGVLHFEREMKAVEGALRLLGVDRVQQSPTPFGGCKQA